MPRLYDEDRELSSFWSWIIIIFYTIGILFFSYVIYIYIQDRMREWDFGELPDAPAEHIYTTQVPGKQKTAPLQIAPLPEAAPTPPVKRENEPARERSPE